MFAQKEGCEFRPHFHIIIILSESLREASLFFSLHALIQVFACNSTTLLKSCFFHFVASLNGQSTLLMSWRSWLRSVMVTSAQIY